MNACVDWKRSHREKCIRLQHDIYVGFIECFFLFFISLIGRYEKCWSRKCGVVTTWFRVYVKALRDILCRYMFRKDFNNSTHSNLFHLRESTKWMKMVDSLNALSMNEFAYLTRFLSPYFNTRIRMITEKKIIHKNLSSCNKHRGHIKFIQYLEATKRHTNGILNNFLSFERTKYLHSCTSPILHQKATHIANIYEWNGWFLF